MDKDQLNMQKDTVRYIVEYNAFGSISREWYPKFFTELDFALKYKEQMLKDFNKNKVSYRVIKEVVTKEILEEGQN